MKLRFDCRDKECPALIEYPPIGEPNEAFNCPRCSRQYHVQHAEELCTGKQLSNCAMCGSEELFIRKNFPQVLGLIIVVIAAVLSLLALRTNALLAYAILASAVLIDALIYLAIGVVTVCYRCRTEYWGVSRNAQHDWFDLATSEKYL